MQRRGFLGAMLAGAVAPAFVKPASLMPLWVPKHALEPEVIATIPNVTAVVRGLTYEQFSARVLALMASGMGLTYEEFARNPQL